MGRIKVIIKSNRRAMYEYIGEEDGKSYYFKRNWANKIRRERKKRMMENK